MTASSGSNRDYKDDVRTQWRAAAAGWRRWYPTLEDDNAGQVVSRTLVDRAHLRPGDHVLDAAAGYGEPGLTAARAVGPQGQVVCCDISQPMLDFARERAADAQLGNVEFVVGDVEDLDFGSERFDAVISRAGIMYFTDVAGMLRRLRSSLRPGGRLAASVWSSPDRVGFAAPLPVMLELLELPPPPAGAPGPFALGDPAMLASVVLEAGFEVVETGALQVIYELESPAAATQWLRDVAPPIAGLVEGHPPELQQRVWDRVTTAGWSSYVTSEGRVRLENEALWVAAQNPD